MRGMPQPFNSAAAPSNSEIKTICQEIIFKDLKSQNDKKLQL
jgi:hypothetical protein